MLLASGIPLDPRKRRSCAFTLVEIMVVVVIIGLLAAMVLPTYRIVTLRSKASTVVNDLRTFSTALITYNLQSGTWPAYVGPGQIPVDANGQPLGLPIAFTVKTPMGGLYTWNYADLSNPSPNVDGVPCRVAITIETVGDNAISDDADLWSLIDQQIDDGDLSNGNVQRGSTSLVYILEK
jgi:prepilin-type N-terminal cleavage/methylation domain-containing protein